MFNEICLQHFSFLIFVIFEVTACHASEYILSATNLKFKNTFLFQQLRSSFSKAFSRKKNKSGSMSDCELDMGNSRPNFSAPNSPLLQIHMPNGQGLIKGSHSSSAWVEYSLSNGIWTLRVQWPLNDCHV